MDPSKREANHRIEVSPPRYYRIGPTETQAEFMQRSAKDFRELVNQLYDGRAWFVQVTWDWEDDPSYEHPDAV